MNLLSVSACFFIRVTDLILFYYIPDFDDKNFLIFFLQGVDIYYILGYNNITY